MTTISDPFGRSMSEALAQVLDVLAEVEQCGYRWLAACPACDDPKRPLCLSPDERGQVILYPTCGCPRDEVAGEIRRRLRPEPVPGGD